jgi:CelD/BcsL family acetyltransferase involved in cellulose biosynthesis
MSWTLLPGVQFASVAGDWQRLHAEGIAAPMLAADFVAALLDEFGDGNELLARYEQGGQILAMAVLARHGRASWATFQPPQAPLGLWIQRAGTDLASALAALMRALPGYPLVLGVTQCDPLLIARPDAGPRGHSRNYIDTARITIATDFANYWGGRGKNLRSNLKKQRSRLAATGVATRLEVIRSADAVAAAIADYGNLESAGWKAEGGTAVSPENAQGRFYRRMMEAFCRRGAGSIYRYWFGAQLVAMDLCIEERDCIVVLKTTYDQNAAAHFSPALLMREEACQQLFDERRFSRIEFYGKVMEWHLRWTDQVRTLYHVNHYRWPILQRLHGLRQTRASAAGAAP